MGAADGTDSRGATRAQGGGGAESGGGIIGPIEFKLTNAQLAFARGLIIRHEAFGDCELHGFTLRFGDYEGAQSFLNRVMGLHTPTTRAYVSMQAIARKLEAAILAAARRKAVA
jgi:hypothetical protein